jgi:DNA-binding CsgD family transcriptional regulator
MAHFKKTLVKRNSAPILTVTEIARLQAFANGETAFSLAESCERSPFTIMKQRTIILEKLGADNITQAVAIGLRGGLIQ